MILHLLIIVLIIRIIVLLILIISTRATGLRIHKRTGERETRGLPMPETNRYGANERRLKKKKNKKK